MAKNRYEVKDVAVDNSQEEIVVPQEEVVEELPQDTVEEIVDQPAVDEVKEETKQEPVEVPEVEEQPEVPVVEESTQEPVATPVVEEVFLSADEIAKLINNNQISPMETLNTILANGSLEYRALVAKLLSYAADMSKDAPMITANTAVGKNYDLFIALRAIINTQNYQIFKIKMDIVNLVFKEFKADAFADSMLTRFTPEWRWDADSLEAYLNTAVLIASLCDITTRQQNLKTISIKLYASKTTNLITPDGVANLEKYYTV